MQALSNALAQNRLHHAYLFTGTRGVGKTTIARIFAKSLNCVNGITATPCGVCSACTEIDSGRFVDLIELDAASNTQVDNMRELLESALYAPTSGRFKVYIIDEVHMLSKSAFNAMLKTLEEPPAHVKFILATTDPQKIPVTVLSRCLQFNLKQLPPALILAHLQYVLEQEDVSFEHGALALLARAAAGSMRDALSLLDQAIAYSDGKVDEATVRTMLGAIDQGYLFDLLQMLLARDGVGATAYRRRHGVAQPGVRPCLAGSGDAAASHRAGADGAARHCRRRAGARRACWNWHGNSAEDVQLFYQIAIHGRNEIDLAPDEYAGFTMTLMRMLAFMPATMSVTARPAGEMVAAAAPPASATLSRKEVSVPKQSDAPASVTESPAQLDWSVLMAQLNVQGMARELARNSTLESFDQGRLTLNLSPQQKHLQSNKIAHDKLQAALTKYFARPVSLQVKVGGGNEITPAALEQCAKQAHQQAATKAIAQDAFVRDAQAQLGAKVVEESIKPIGQENAR